MVTASFIKILAIIFLILRLVKRMSTSLAAKAWSARKLKAPLLLVNGTGATSAPVKAAFNGMPTRTDIYVLGGTAVITDEVVNNHIK